MTCERKMQIVTHLTYVKRITILVTEREVRSPCRKSQGSSELLSRYSFEASTIPHFHTVYGEYNGLFAIETLEMLEGDLSSKAQKLVREWAEQHKSELLDMWDMKTLKKLPPLE